jgi:hypothetical protein
MNKFMILILSLILCSTLSSNGSIDTSQELLSVNDVEKIIGIKGIKLIPKDPTIGAGGDLNFAMEDNTILLIAAIQDISMYNEWKKQEGFFHADVPGIGDEAFEGPSVGEYRYVLIFRKGQKAISLSSFFNMKAGGKPFFTQEQLRELAKIMISQL